MSESNNHKKNDLRVQDRFVNRLISGSNSFRYWMTEPGILRIMRLRYEHLYKNLPEDPLVTILIPTYNRGKLLVERTLPSIFAQTYQNFEIVIVGDHCIDNTPQILAQVDDPRVRFFDLPKRGKYPDDITLRWFVQGTAPINKARKLAKGKWLVCMTDDDILFPNHIDSLLRFAQKGQYEFVSAAYIEERHGQKKVVDVRNMYPRIGGYQTWLYRSYLRFFKSNINSWRKSWNRPGDYDLQWRMFKAGVRMGFLDEVVTYIPPVEGTGTVGSEARELLAQKGEKYELE